MYASHIWESIWRCGPKSRTCTPVAEHQIDLKQPSSKGTKKNQREEKPVLSSLSCNPFPGALTNGARKLNVITHVCDFQILLLRHLCFCRANDLDLFLLISGCYITESKRKRERNVVQAHKGEIAHRLTSKVELQCPSHRVNNATEVFFFS